MYLSFCILCGTGIMLHMAPKGIEWTAMGIHEDGWKFAHLACAALMIAGVVAHLAINRKWIAKSAFKGRRVLLCLFLAAGIVIALLPAFLEISVMQ